MSNDPSKDAADEAREMREHEREAQKRDSNEESPAGEEEAGGVIDSTVGDLDADDKPAPPGVSPGNITG